MCVCVSVFIFSLKKNELVVSPKHLEVCQMTTMQYLRSRDQNICADVSLHQQEHLWICRAFITMNCPNPLPEVNLDSFVRSICQTLSDRYGWQKVTVSNILKEGFAPLKEDKGQVMFELSFRSMVQPLMSLNFVIDSIAETMTPMDPIIRQEHRHPVSIRRITPWRPMGQNRCPFTSP